MAEITQFEGDIFWPEYDTERDCQPDDEMDNVGTEEIVEFEQAKRMPNFFGVWLKDEPEPRYFETKEEAEAVAAAAREQL